MNKPHEEIHADGSRWIGDGPTFIVFVKSGAVVLMIHGEKAEHRALRKKFHPEVTSGGITLTITDLLSNENGVPPYSESLALIVRSIVHEQNSEEAAKVVLKKLGSVVIAARRRVMEPLGKTDHEQFRDFVTYLAKQSGRVPTRSEIRRAMFLKAPANKFSKNARAITRLCSENGLSWLPIGKAGRPRKKKDS